MSSITSRFKTWLDRARGVPIERDLSAFHKMLARINAHEEELKTQTDGFLRNAAAVLREEAAKGDLPKERLVDAFALAREAARRTLGMRPYDVQVLAGLALFEGYAVEMMTGEGKTLAAVAPTFVNALSGNGAHILTFNDYLARRDAQWMGPAYELLGLSVGYVQEGMELADRKLAYAADVTYATAKEAGFDYLRDQLAQSAQQTVQRGFHYAIVDEADSLLIDEARIPLVIAGIVGEQSAPPARIAQIVSHLEAGKDYEADEHGRQVFFTEHGLIILEQRLGCGGLHQEQNRNLLAAANLALHAHALLRRDVDYIVRGGMVEHVDEFTGRVAVNRRWPDGLQAAIEAKEGLAAQHDGTILGSITLQHFMGLYGKLAGMTATAESAAEELKEFYGLTTVVVPPNKPCVREDLPDLIFPNHQAKIEALVEEVRRNRASGRPVLVGTASVIESECLAAALAAKDIDCRVLNAKNDELEAGIVTQAGNRGAVTISTNMAGRGTDIRLGADEREAGEIKMLGGLLVIGTNRHESRRIDDQLRGRSGRQGDPGASRFFLSLEDELIKKYAIHELLPLPDGDDPIEDPICSREIGRAQRILEGENLAIRKMLYKYSAPVEEYRRMLREKRDTVLFDDDFDSLFAVREPQLYDSLVAAAGEDSVRQAERRATLVLLDRAWMRFLADVADIREGVYLIGLGKTNTFGMAVNPIGDYQQQVAEAFAAMLAHLEEEIVQVLSRAVANNGKIELDEQSLKAPSSTWTYLINDAPAGPGLERFFKGIKQKIVEALGKNGSSDR